jgi:hypothetical protein
VAAERIKVEVSRRILHIGPAAYPLQNIARVQSQVLKFARWPTIRSFVKAAVIWIVLGAAATAAIKFAADRQAGSITPANQGHYIAIAWAVAAALIAVSAMLLLVRLAHTWQRYYALVIDTAGPARAALVNPDRVVISDLVANCIGSSVPSQGSPAMSARLPAPAMMSVKSRMPGSSLLRKPQRHAGNPLSPLKYRRIISLRAQAGIGGARWPLRQLRCP